MVVLRRDVVMLAMVVMAVVVCAAARADDWPGFRGPNRNGIGEPGPGLADAWPDGGPKMLWRSEPLGVTGWDHDRSQVAVCDGLAYILTRRQVDGEWQRVLTCLDGEGRIRWQHTTPGTPASGHQTQNPTPTILDGRIYAQADRYFYCLNADTGEAAWENEADFGYTVQSPLVIGRVMVFRSGPGLMAFSLADGKPAWTFTGRGSQSLQSPVPWQTPAGDYIVAVVDEERQAVCVDPVDGSPLWDLELNTGETRIQPDNRTIPVTPTISDDHLVITREERRHTMLYRLFADDPKRQPELLWYADAMRNSPLIFQGHVYLGYTRRDVGYAACLDMADGQTNWLFSDRNSDGVLERGFKNYGDPILVDGKTFVTMNQKVAMFRPNPDDLGLLGKTPQIGSCDTSNVAIADGRMWVVCYRREGVATVACFDISAPPGAKPTITLTQAGLDPATVGRWYERRLWVSSGNGMRTWRISEGKLPAGLTLDPKGYITGRATEAGEFPLTLTVADEDGDTDATSLTLRVAAE